MLCLSDPPMWRCEILQLKERHLVNQPLHRASGAHGEVVTQVSCYSDAVMWRYATLPVWNEISRKLLFNNLSSV